MKRVFYRTRDRQVIETCQFHNEVCDTYNDFREEHKASPKPQNEIDELNTKLIEMSHKMKQMLWDLPMGRDRNQVSSMIKGSWQKSFTEGSDYYQILLGNRD